MISLSLLAGLTPLPMKTEPILRVTVTGRAQEGEAARTVHSEGEVSAKHSGEATLSIGLDLKYTVSAEWPDIKSAPSKAKLEALLFCLDGGPDIDPLGGRFLVNGRTMPDSAPHGSLRQGRTILLITEADVKMGKASFSFSIKADRTGKVSSRSSSSGYGNGSPQSKRGELSRALVCVPNLSPLVARKTSKDSSPYVFLVDPKTNLLEPCTTIDRRIIQKSPLPREVRDQVDWRQLDRIYTRSYHRTPSDLRSAQRGGVSESDLKALAEIAFGKRWNEKRRLPEGSVITWQETSARSWCYPLALVGQPRQQIGKEMIPYQNVRLDTVRALRTKGYGIKGGQSIPEDPLEPGQKRDSFLSPKEGSYYQHLIFDSSLHVAGIVRVQLSGRTLLKGNAGVKIQNTNAQPHWVNTMVERFGPDEERLIQLLEGPFPMALLDKDLERE